MAEMQELEAFRDWIGRARESRDVVTAAPLACLAALLDRDEPPPRDGDAAPPLAHWLYFLPTYRQSAAGPDGHAARGDFLPPAPLPRRMWAGSRLEFLRPLRVGAEISRLSRIQDVAPKRGRSGPLLFVTVRHEVSDRSGLVLSDEQDLVFRGEAPLAPPPSEPPGRMSDVPWRREIRPDPLLLFRYSAVTFNGHRIHYDHPYATGVEGYPGLVVHGPLVATLLLDLLRRERPEAALRSYSFRALRPLFDNAAFHACGAPDDARRSARLWTRDAAGAVTMEATAAW
ncbi:MAG TPA: MaoC family dehydratase N-terminal domain-containing protein [Myxococcota bacterium]|nr:MaoC family dehydratase N-terminal domain-containing protein [Myxococcota bacterium]